MNNRLISALSKVLGRRKTEEDFRMEFRAIFSQYVEDLGKIAHDNQDIEMVAAIDFTRNKEKREAEKTIKKFLKKIQAAYDRGFKKFTQLVPKYKAENPENLKIIATEEMRRFHTKVTRHLKIINVRAAVYLEDIEEYDIRLGSDDFELLKELDALTPDELFNAWPFC